MPEEYNEYMAGYLVDLVYSDVVAQRSLIRILFDLTGETGINASLKFIEEYKKSRENRRCGRCQTTFAPGAFIGEKGGKYPWCAVCRKADPQGAKKAKDHERFSAKYQAMTPEERRHFRNKVEKKHQEELPIVVPKFDI